MMGQSKKFPMAMFPADKAWSPPVSDLSRATASVILVSLQDGVHVRLDAWPPHRGGTKSLIPALGEKLSGLRAKYGGDEEYTFCYALFGPCADGAPGRNQYVTDVIEFGFGGEPAGPQGGVMVPVEAFLTSLDGIR